VRAQTLHHCLLVADGQLACSGLRHSGSLQPALASPVAANETRARRLHSALVFVVAKTALAAAKAACSAGTSARAHRAELGSSRRHFDRRGQRQDCLFRTTDAERKSQFGRGMGDGLRRGQAYVGANVMLYPDCWSV
jgi:hypothetical protein